MSAYKPSQAAIDAAAKSIAEHNNNRAWSVMCESEQNEYRGMALEALYAAHETEDASRTEREHLASFMLAHSFSTGHGNTHADLLNELGWQIDELRAGLKGDAALRVESPDLHAAFQAMAPSAPLPWSIYGDRVLSDANGGYICEASLGDHRRMEKLAMILTAVNTMGGFTAVAANGVWLAKSVIEFEIKDKGRVIVTLPEWLAIERGLV